MGEKEQNNGRLAKRVKEVRSQRETSHFYPWQLFTENNETIDFPLGCQKIKTPQLFSNHNQAAVLSYKPLIDQACARSGGNVP